MLQNYSILYVILYYIKLAAPRIWKSGEIPAPRNVGRRPSALAVTKPNITPGTERPICMIPVSVNKTTLLREPWPCNPVV